VKQAQELGRVGMIYVETPANPTNGLVDIARCAEIARSLTTRKDGARSSPSTTPSWGRSGSARSARRGFRDLLPDQVRRRPTAI